jgi:hypothetical protein
LVSDAENPIEKLPDEFCIPTKTTGEKRKVLAKLYGVYQQSKLNAPALRAAINELRPRTKARTMDKVKELKESIRKAEEAQPSMIA